MMTMMIFFSSVSGHPEEDLNAEGISYGGSQCCANTPELTLLLLAPETGSSSCVWATDLLLQANLNEHVGNVDTGSLNGPKLLGFLCTALLYSTETFPNFPSAFSPPSHIFVEFV